MASSSRSRSRESYLTYDLSSSPTPGASPSTFATSSSSFSSRSPTFAGRAASPPRVAIYGPSSQSSRSVRFSLDRPTSPGRSVSVIRQISGGNSGRHVSSSSKKTCMCAPTNHPGSFRCSLHRKPIGGGCRGGGHNSSSYNSGRSLNFRRSAMTNSLVRICGVEGDLVRRALSALIRPSSHQLQRRFDYRPRPSRFLVAFMKAQNK